MMQKAGRLGSFALTAALCGGAAACLVRLSSDGVPELHTAAGWTAVAVALALAAVGSLFGLGTVRKFAALGSAAVLAIAIFYIVVIRYDLFVYFENTDTLLALIKQYDSYAVLIFLAIQFAQVTILPLPASLTTIAGITVFGITKTVLYSSAAIIAASMVAFALGRTFGVRLAVWLCGSKAVAKYRALLKGREAVLLYAMFLLPLFPDDLLCVIAGLGTMSYRSFLVMMILTRPLGVLWIAGMYQGAITIPANAAGITMWICVALVTFALFAVLYKYGDKIAEKVGKLSAKLFAKTSRKPKKARIATVRDDEIYGEIRKVSASGKNLVTDVCATKKPPEGG